MSLRTAATIRAAVTAAAILATAGCTGTLLDVEREPSRLFNLSPKNTFSPDLPAADWQLTIAVPIAQAALNNTRIALQRQALTLEYYSYANWTDTAPIMLQTLMVESFANSGKIVSVGRQSANLRSDFNLQTELREFQAEYFGTEIPMINVRIIAQIIKMPERIIVAAETFDYKEKASGVELDSVVEAFDLALGKTLKRLVEWTLLTADKFPVRRN